MSGSLDKHRRMRLDVANAELRAQAIAIGFLQLCRELKNSDVLGDDALLRIKDMIASHIAISPPRGQTCQQYHSHIMARLDRIMAEDPSHDR
jgi:hypothetical protein